MRSLTAVLLPLVLGTVCLAAQRDANRTAAETFEVVSVRQNSSGDTISSARWFPGGRFTAVNTRLDHLVLQAFGIHPGLAYMQLDGGFRPEMKCLRNCSSRDEILSARFDIQGSAPTATTAARQLLILRTLLEERFKLRARLETRESPAYLLTVARTGRLGPRLLPSSHDCGEWARRENEAKARGGPMPSAPTDAAGKTICDVRLLSRSAEFIHVRRSAGPISSLLGSIRGQLPFQVFDRTGLTGNFEWELISSMPVVSKLGPEVKQNAPTLDVALEEQLGLKLVRSTAPLEVLVIDSVAMPTPN